jgi:hypothetical protein
LYTVIVPPESGFRGLPQFLLKSGRRSVAFPARRLSGNIPLPASGRIGGSQKCACSAL